MVRSSDDGRNLLIKKYADIIQSFLEGTVSVDEFERTYLKEFKAETGKLDSRLFNTLNELFISVDCYWHECQEGQETAFEISEAQLRKDAATALSELPSHLS